MFKTRRQPLYSPSCSWTWYLPGGHPVLLRDVGIKTSFRWWHIFRSFKGQDIPMGKGEKYEADFDDKEKKAYIAIKNISIDDMGTYVLNATNGQNMSVKNFSVNVKGKY